MSKKKYNDYIQDAPAPPEPEIQALPKEQAEAIAELYRSAKSMNGQDHMKLCAFYVVNREHCDCGLSDLRMSVLQLEASQWTP